MKVSAKHHVLAAAIGSLVASGAAVAQPGQLETIIVTSEFREADVQDTPIAITAVSAEMLEARSQTNIFEVAAQAPNVTLKPGGSSVGPAMVAFIRGVGQTDFNYALEPGVGVYVDDIYYPTLTGSLIDLLDLERVEVLRGPQGTLAGKNSIGGAIKLYTRQPTGDNPGTVSLTLGSYDRVDVRGAIDMTLADDLTARIAGVSSTVDGFVDRIDYGCANPGSNVPNFGTSRLSDCKVGTSGGRSWTAGRINLAWDPSDTFDASFSLDVTNEQSDPIASVLIDVNESGIAGTGPFIDAGTYPGGYPDPNYAGAGFLGTYIIGEDGSPVYLTDQFVPSDPFVSYGTFMDPWPLNPNTHQAYSPSSVRPQTTLDQWGFSATFDWLLNENLSLTWINAYREYQSSFAQDEDNSPVNGQFLLQHLDHDQWSTEIRLNGGSDRFDYTAGVFWFEQDGTLEANVNLFYVQFNFIHGPDPTPSYNHAAFANFSFDLSDRLHLSAGLRYSEDEKTYTHFRRNIDGTPPAGACIFTPGIGPIPHNIDNPTNCALVGLFNQGATWSDERTDWRIALDYDIGDNIMTYLQVATGYRGGGVNPRPFVLPQLLPFNSEEMTAYEIGFKSQLADNSLRLNAALFYNDYTDIIMTLNPCPLVSPGPCALPVNSGSAKVPGLEVELEWYMSERWSLDLSASWMDFEFKETVAPITTSMVPPYTPETKWSAGIQYNHPLNAGGEFGFRLDASYQDDIYVLPVNHPSNLIKGYELVNARFMWKSSAGLWDAALEITNAGDEYYFHTLFDQLNSGGYYVSGQPGAPRMYAVTMRRSF